ncbi:MAG: class I SAM-dependent methyltransferase, partial [Myxococcales bacterium]|nr:class I SAM-dependent methyltransferase [Myxococcales bacterium]
VSIEMIEAVGEEFWPVYFRTVAERLKPGGRAAIQAIACSQAAAGELRHSARRSRTLRVTAACARASSPAAKAAGRHSAGSPALRVDSGTSRRYPLSREIARRAPAPRNPRQIAGVLE